MNTCLKEKRNPHSLFSASPIIPEAFPASLSLSDFSYALCHEACTDLEWHWEKKIYKGVLCDYHSY